MISLEKKVRISNLYFFYGKLLTEKQNTVINLYYNEDTSLGEIASLLQITRQAVKDCLKKAEITLESAESKLKTAERFILIKNTLNDCIKSTEDEIVKQKLINLSESLEE